MIPVARRLSLSAVASAALALGGCGSAPDLPVEAYRVSLALDETGALDVEEVLVLAAQPSPESAIEYPLPSTWLDDVVDVSVRIGEDAVQPGLEPSEVDIEAEPGGLVRWRPEAGAGTGREVRLRYRALGVLAVSGARGRLRWPLAPRVRGPVGSVSAQLTLPEGMTPVVGPVVEGVDDPDGWQVSQMAVGFLVSAEFTHAANAPVLATEVVLGGHRVAEPRWQYNTARGRELMPAFVSAGLFLVIVGLGALWMIRFQYPPVPTTPLSSGNAMAATTDADRLAVRRGLKVAGVVLLVMGALSVPVVDLSLGRFGRWPMALPAGILIVGVLFVVAGRRFTVSAGADRPVNR